MILGQVPSLQKYHIQICILLKSATRIFMNCFENHTDMKEIIVREGYSNSKNLQPMCERRKRLQYRLREISCSANEYEHKSYRKKKKWEDT